MSGAPIRAVPSTSRTVTVRGPPSSICDSGAADVAQLAADLHVAQRSDGTWSAVTSTLR